MVAGWIAGEVLSQALGSREWVKDRKSFLASLYNQRRYVVDDIVIGDYGGECKAGVLSNLCIHFLGPFFPVFIKPNTKKINKKFLFFFCMCCLVILCREG
ncbi:receptor-type adenylate cyclase [Trypanosoma cruzi Dm28c]|uniref:Receptor-type adenylate cyclase n=1 Tax=Trypanosoma cruzi Dm28c TaxID=1416333 RepID=V5BIH3_TRYCR|nr:receptor-type adenylate cyclase [Trypanosoma cruzi Dm28c]